MADESLTVTIDTKALREANPVPGATYVSDSIDNAIGIGVDGNTQLTCDGVPHTLDPAAVLTALYSSTDPEIVKMRDAAMASLALATEASVPLNAISEKMDPIIADAQGDPTKIFSPEVVEAIAPELAKLQPMIQQLQGNFADPGTTAALKPLLDTLSDLPNHTNKITLDLDSTATSPLVPICNLAEKIGIQ